MWVEKLTWEGFGRGRKINLGGFWGAGRIKSNGEGQTPFDRKVEERGGKMDTWREHFSGEL